MSKTFAIRFLIGLAVGASLAMPIQSPLATALLPLFRAELSRLTGDFRIDRLELSREGPETVFRLELGLAHDIVMNGHVARPDPRGEARSTTMIDNVTMPSVLLIAFAWPVKRPIAYLWRLLCIPPALLVLWMLDVPLVLWSGLWGLVVDAFDPGRFSPLLIWEHFIHSGGRIALAALLGAGIGAACSGADPEPAGAVDGEATRAAG